MPTVMAAFMPTVMVHAHHYDGIHAHRYGGIERWWRELDDSDYPSAPRGLQVVNTLQF